MTQALPASSDVLVMGGGPAGSTAATLLARRGWHVTLVEKQHHPRFHIGESLLPMNMPVLDRLGVLDKVHAIGVKKLGADFPANNARGYNVFRFSRALDAAWPYAYQVRREEFDQLLFAHARDNGAHTFEGVRVTALSFGKDGVTAALETESGEQRTLRARYIVDATGRDTFLGGTLRLKRKHPKHQSAALFAHFRGVQLRAGEDAGNISIYRFEHGWIWMIPLRDGCVSVGAVCFPEYLKQRTGGNDQFLMQTLQSIPDVWKRMEGAEIVGNLHVTGNYSYVCRRISGRGWIMAGDAYAFLDPIFSSGVYLAMTSAELAAGVVDATLKEPRREAGLQRAYERHVKRGIHALSWFIFRFTSPAMHYLFANPRNVFGVEQAMISMLAGDVFSNRNVTWRLRIFKLIYLIASLNQWKEAWANARRRKRQIVAEFRGGTTSQDHV